MFAVSQSVWQWEVVKPFVLILAALLAGMLLAGMLAGATPEPPLPPGDEPVAMVIVSPWSGVFNACEYPGGLPFVGEGSRVLPGTVVGIVDAAMRPFPVLAGVEGTITRVLVADGQMVHGGQPLFKVLPARKPE
jgi:biotin carboxyl carrier protein